jgi:FkbM family methyltransferase
MPEFLVFDIGYNMGNFTRQVLALEPSAKIIGVEGHPMYFELPKSSNVTLIKAVVSNKDDTEIPFFICDSNPGINSINPEWISIIRHSHFFDKTKRMVMVPSITLDRLISQYGIPDILKMDIEGAESIALEKLSHKCGLITFEWSEEFFFDAKKCIKRLQEIDYSLFSFSEQTDIFDPNRAFYSWEELKLYNDIIPERKKRWGMIYAK